MSTTITEFGELRVSEGDDALATEFEFREGELWIQIEGSGWEGNYGSVMSMSVEDARELLTYLQKVIPR